MSKLIDTIEILSQFDALKEATDSLIPEIAPYFDRLADGIVNVKVRQIKRF